MSVIKTGALSHCIDRNNLSQVKLEEGTQNCYAIPNAMQQRNTVFYTADGMRFEMVSAHGRGNPRKFYLHETGIEIKNSPGYDGPAGCGSYGLSVNSSSTKNTPCMILVDVNGDKKPNPPVPFVASNQNFKYSFSMPNDKRLTDVFNILITEDRAIPFGVVAQRAMYEK